jgi:predicted ATP-binding protein involved in virulence
MKLHSLRIQNFRAIQDSGLLDFTDSISQPRSVTLIVGSNGSGKTSILDAIQVVVRCLENPLQPELREGLKFSAQQLVYNNGFTNNLVKIELEYSIEKNEVVAITEMLKQTMDNKFYSDNLSQLIEYPLTISPSTLIWKYPIVKQNQEGFSFSALPRESHKTLGARGLLKQLVDLGKMKKSMFEHIGGICYLDQRRSLILSRNFSKENEDNLLNNDVLSWLRGFYLKDLTWNTEKYGESFWAKTKRLFNEICAPTQLIGLESSEDMDTLILKKEGVEYDLSQMSSGEHQVLRILVGLVSERAKNSIVLIDEVELHLHPAWQAKLIYGLRKDTISNNQYIFTTHSPFVTQLFYKDEIINLGDLGE